MHVAGPTTLLFPNYDGNAMFLSMGNVVDTASIGMLFIDMEKPNRVRVQARATVSADDPELGRWPGADLVVRAEVTKVFKNCGRYIHKHVRIGQSPYVPDADGKVAHPSWKRIDALQAVMPQVRVSALRWRAAPSRPRSTTPRSPTAHRDGRSPSVGEIVYVICRRDALC